MLGISKGGTARASPLLYLTATFSLISLVFGILVIIGCTHNRSVINSTYFLQLNVTHIDLPGSFFDALTSDAQHALGIHDFYRYGLWGFCDGFNDTVVFCSEPKPGNATNPIAALNAEINHKYHIPLPNNVETDVNRLGSLSTFVFACWIIGTVFDFGTLVASALTGCRSRTGACIVGIFALSAFIFLLVGSILVQILYSVLRDAINVAGNFDIVNLQASLGTQMFTFVWISCVASGLVVILAAGMCCWGKVRR